MYTYRHTYRLKMTGTLAGVSPHEQDSAVSIETIEIRARLADIVRDFVRQLEADGDDTNLYAPSLTTNSPAPAIRSEPRES